jgi:hypothetical protein
MNKESLLVLAAAAFTAGAAGCGESSNSAALRTWADAIEGIYQIDMMTRNEASCSAEGPSSLADSKDHLAVLRGSDIGGDWIKAMGCSDPADCRMRVEAVRANRAVAFPFSYDFRMASDDRLQGIWITTGHSGQVAGQCIDASVTDIVLTRPTDTQLRVEARSIVVDHPADSDGVCWTDDTQSAAAGKPCSQLDVIQATRLEAL